MSEFKETMGKQMVNKKFFYSNGLPRVMLGAACGDIAGSIYEWFNTKQKPERIMRANCFFTDDTVMTVAVAEALSESLAVLGEDRLNAEGAEDIIKKRLVEKMQSFGRRYPNAGYGGTFVNWIDSANPEPYNSWGNGSAMRASCPCTRRAWRWQKNSARCQQKLPTTTPRD